MKKCNFHFSMEKSKNWPKNFKKFLTLNQSTFLDHITIKFFNQIICFFREYSDSSLQQVPSCTGLGSNPNLLEFATTINYNTTRELLNNWMNITPLTEPIQTNGGYRFQTWSQNLRNKKRLISFKEYVEKLNLVSKMKKVLQRNMSWL